jgi:hypothetical protein
MTIRAQTLPILLGHAVAQLVETLCYMPNSRIRFPMVPHYGPGVDLIQEQLVLISPREMSTNNISWG